MKIDPRIQLPGDIQQEAVRNSRKSGGASSGASDASSAKPAADEDTVSISSTLGDVQTLKTSFASVPEVRTPLVNALRQQVNSGQYQPDSLKVADAVLAEQAGANNAA